MKNYDNNNNNNNRIYHCLGIDPGPIKSAYILISLCNNKLLNIIDKNYVDNDNMIKIILSKHIKFNDIEIAIETIVSYGNTMGQSTINTAIFVGRFYQLVKDISGKPTYITRPDVYLNLCNKRRGVKSKNITQSLKDRYGELGTKANPGRLYNIKGAPKGSLGHIWSALAIAITFSDLKYGKIK